MTTKRYVTQLAETSSYHTKCKHEDRLKEEGGGNWGRKSQHTVINKEHVLKEGEHSSIKLFLRPKIKIEVMG